ncbi:DUF3810 family protein [Mangrovibacterium sp.]|uniref:DUF3810 family protein n=1 Tax=Mangrovibacterium sp. TaxID=1961364 RepID=UPI003565B68F
MLWLAVICFGLTRLFAAHPVFTNRYYSIGFYPYVARGLSRFSDLFSFSLYNLLLLSALAGVALLIILAVSGRIKWKYMLVALVNLVAFAYCSFFWLWGFNYFRTNLFDRIGLQQDSIRSEQYELVFQSLIKEANGTGFEPEALIRSHVDSLVDRACYRLSNQMGLPYFQREPGSKVALAEGMLSRSSVYGYFGYLFNEVHVSRLCQPEEYPFLLAHELAHRYGIAGESEANFYAWLVCYESDSPVLQQAARVFLIRHLLDAGYGEMYRRGKSNGKLPENTNTDELHWFTQVADCFLKWNNLEDGFNDYERVILPVSQYLLQSGKLKKPDIKPKRKGRRNKKGNALVLHEFTFDKSPVSN